MSPCQAWAGGSPFKTLPSRGLPGALLHTRPFQSRGRRHSQAGNSKRPSCTQKLFARADTAEAEQKAARRRQKERGRSTYSPQSYKELLQDAVQSIEYALEDSVKRMEVDFPTLSGDSEQPPADLHSTAWFSDSYLEGHK